MCHLPAPHAPGVPLLIVASLTWPLLAAAADAGPEPDPGLPAASDAGLAPESGDGGTASEPTLLFPQIGATDVVTNPALLMRMEKVALDPKIYQGSTDGLLLREPSGNLVAVGRLLVIEPPLDPTSDPRVEVSSATLELKANTRYEVLSRVALCDQGTPIPILCFAAEYHSLGAFETGSLSDHEPPSISSVHADGFSARCLNSLSVVASDDLAPPNALRFWVGNGQAWLGPTLSVPTSFADVGTVDVVPVDPSGNRGAALPVQLGVCGPNSGYGSVTPPDGPASSSSPSATSTPLNPAPRRHKHGCSLGAPPAAAPPWSWGLLALASLCLYRRRQRRS
jgi:MYXO-CTERM domain-containing protein